MNPKQTLYVLVVHGCVAAVVILGASVLAYHGSIDGEALTAIYGAALGFAGASSGAIAAVGQAVNGKATVSDETLRQAMSSPGYSMQPNDAPEPPQTPNAN